MIALKQQDLDIMNLNWQGIGPLGKTFSFSSLFLHARLVLLMIGYVLKFSCAGRDPSESFSSITGRCGWSFAQYFVKYASEKCWHTRSI